MQNSQDSTQDLVKYTVAIQKAGSSRILGTGVIVTDDGLIVTCYHVVGNIQARSLDEIVDVCFASIPEIKGTAYPLKEFCDLNLDIAFLRLQEEPPQQITFANLSKTIDPTHTFRSFGFRRKEIFDGLYSNGTILGKVLKKFKEYDNKISLQEVIQLKSDDIHHGMSGAAVLDTQINRVIGVVSEHLATSSNVDKNLALAIPVDTLLQTYPELSQKNPGLKILEFLRKIGLEENRWYQRIEDVYVPPVEYGAIKEALIKDRIVFITGPKEYGKTFTAIRLLWEYCKKENYEPKYIQAREEEKLKVRERLTTIENEIRPHHIVYFEDPFGKTKYQEDKQLEREIATIIDTVANADDAYVVITSREEVFKQFQERHTAEVELGKFEKKLNIQTPSYSYNRRQEILLRCAEVMNCEWLKNEQLKNLILEFIKYETKLPTPLNIKDFVTATKRSVSREEIITKINAKSKETENSFGEEIKEMNNFKILFLSFPFISETVSIPFVRDKYETLIANKKLVQDLNIEDDAWRFDGVFNWFKDSKIDTKSGRVRFSHPSYSEAIKHILEENGTLTKTGRIVSRVLMELSGDYLAAADVAKTIASNFDILPENNRNLLFEMAHNDRTAETVAEVIQYNFDKIPASVLYKLIIDLGTKDYKFWDTARVIADSIAFNFDRLSENTRNILHEMLNSNETVPIVISVLEDNFENLPESVIGELLMKLADKKQNSAEVAKIIDMKFDKMPTQTRQNLLLQLVKSDQVASGVAYAVANHFDNLPKDLRENLLLQLVKSDQVASGVAYALSTNFNKLPNNLQQVLFDLAHKPEAAEGLVSGIADNFDKLTFNIQQLLFKLADRDEVKSNMAYSVPRNFHKLPKDLREELLLKIANNHSAMKVLEREMIFISKEAAESMACTITSNFNKLPFNIQQLLFKLVENFAGQDAVTKEILTNFDKLPLKIHKALIFHLADNRYTEGVSSSLLKEYCNNLPEPDRKKMLSRLVKKGIM